MGLRWKRERILRTQDVRPHLPFLGLGAFFGILPAILVAAYIELYLIRSRLGVKESASAAEEGLLRTSKIALRRRMAQVVLTLGMGGMLIGISLPPLPLAQHGAWQYGLGFQPIGGAPLWAQLRTPGFFVILLAIRPADTSLIRFAAFGWACYILIDSWYLRLVSINCDLFCPKPLWQFRLFQAITGVIAVASLYPCVFAGKWSLPGRLALQWLWACVRVSCTLSLPRRPWLIGWDGMASRQVSLKASTSTWPRGCLWLQS